MEVVVLTMLATPTMTRWELPEKYHSDRFVIDMLVSCRHRYRILHFLNPLNHPMSFPQIPEAQRGVLLVEAIRGGDDVQPQTEQPAGQTGAAPL